MSHNISITRGKCINVIPEGFNRGSSNISLVQGTTYIDGATRNERTGFPLRACGNDVVVCGYVPRFIEKLQCHYLSVTNNQYQSIFQRSEGFLGMLSINLKSEEKVKTLRILSESAAYFNVIRRSRGDLSKSRHQP